MINSNPFRVKYIHILQVKVYHKEISVLLLPMCRSDVEITA